MKNGQKIRKFICGSSVDLSAYNYVFTRPSASSHNDSYSVSVTILFCGRPVGAELRCQALHIQLLSSAVIGL